MYFNSDFVSKDFSVANWLKQLLNNYRRLHAWEIEKALIEFTVLEELRNAKHWMGPVFWWTGETKTKNEWNVDDKWK